MLSIIGLSVKQRDAISGYISGGRNLSWVSMKLTKMLLVVF